MADVASSGLTGDTDAALFGRERELGALREALAVALAGRGALVLVGGEAGIGKTTLTETICAEAAARGALVLVGRCYDLSETPPYGPWREALAAYRATDGLPAPPATLGPAAADEPVATVSSQDALFGQLRDFCIAIATQRLFVLLLDDLHWADPASLDLLRVLGRVVPAQRLLLLATYRSDELTRHHPLYGLLPTLVREAHATRLDLRPLADDSLAPLVDVRFRLPAPETARLVAYLRAHAEGNPFYTGELLRTLEEEGLLRPVPGTRAAGEAGDWHLGDLRAVRVPPLLRQVLDQRLARLGEEAVRLLAVAAVIGQIVPHDLWAAVADAAEEALLDVVERAVEARVLVESPVDGGYRFAHALIREALYEGLLLPRRRAWHRRVADALLALPVPDPDAVAHHYRQAGDPRAAEWLIRAGERAQRAYAWFTAADRYEAALALLEEQGADPRRRVELLITLAQLRRYGNTAQSIALMEEAARLAEALGDEAQASSARFEAGHLRCIGWADPAGLAEMATAMPVLEALLPEARASLPALRILGVAPDERYHRGALVQWMAQFGRYDEAWELAAPFRAGELGITGRGLAGLARVHSMRGRPEAARRALIASRAIFRTSGQHTQVAGSYRGELRLVALPYEADRVALRRHLASEAEAALARGSDANAAVLPRSQYLDMLVLEGTWDEARELAQAGHTSVYVVSRLEAAETLARVAREQGEREQAWAAVGDLFPAGPETAPGATDFPTALQTFPVAVALALDAGDLVGAHAWLLGFDRWLDWADAVRGRAEAQLGWASYRRATGDLAAARELAEAALALASEPRQPLALLAARRALGELATTDARTADAQAHLDAALALARACEAPYEVALTLLALADLRAATGDREGARAPLDEARALLAPLEARPALARAAALAATLDTPPTAAPPASYPAGLSAREAEVLRLIARGLTNAQAAEALYLSPRTIDQHLRSIYGKLGVENRAAATRFAVEHGLA